MNIARVGLLGVALVAAGGAAFLVRGMTHKVPKPKPAVVVEAPSTKVLVAARAIEPGSILTPADLRWQKWPQDAVNPSYFTAKAAPEAAQDAAGAIVRAHLEPGEPVTAAKFVKAKGAGFMAALLVPGMRAVSIKISKETSAGGFVLPGDHVDVISVRKMGEAADEGRKSAHIVLEDVRVLAMGSTFEQTGGDKSIEATNATLELSAGQAELVSTAQANGELSLALRAAATGDLTASIRQAPHADADMIQLVRYGHATRATPALAQGGTP